MNSSEHLTSARAILAALALARAATVHYELRNIWEMQSMEATDAFFPAVLRQPQLLPWALLAPLLPAAVALVRPRRSLLQVSFGALLGSACILGLHQGTFYTAYPTGQFWASLVGLWFSRLSPSEPTAPLRLAQLTRYTTAMLFLGYPFSPPVFCPETDGQVELIVI